MNLRRLERAALLPRVWLIPPRWPFNSAGNLFETDFISGNIYEFATDGTRSTFASGLSAPSGLAFQGEILPVPEPTTACLMIFGAAGMLFLRKKVLVNPPADVEKRKFGKRKAEVGHKRTQRSQRIVFALFAFLCGE